MGPGEPAAVLDERQIDRVEPLTPRTQRRTEQRLDRRVALRVVAGPDRQQIEGDVDDRDLGPDRLRGRLAPETRLEADERQDEPVLEGEDLAVDHAGPSEGAGRVDDLGELVAHVVEVSRIE